jgi:hypothetical protein
MEKRGFYKWSDGTPTQFTRLTQLSPEGKPLNSDIYLQGMCVAMNSIFTMATIGDTVGNTGVPGLWYKANCNSFYAFFCSKVSTHQQ